jgi:predicted nucleotidyltransferase
MEVLKHFKDRLAGADVSGCFELEPCVIYRCIVGSRAFGLEHDESDTDVRGVYVAPAELQWSLFGAPEQFEDHAAQACYWELQKFLLMALKANPNILECLYSPIVEKVTPLGEELLAMRNLPFRQWGEFLPSSAQDARAACASTSDLGIPHARAACNRLKRSLNEEYKTAMPRRQAA